MGRAAVFLAEGFEEIEALTVVDICRRCGITMDMISVTEETQVVSSHGVKVAADRVLSQAEFDAYDMLILPGGMPGTKNLEACGPLMEQIDAFYEKGKY
ncbi:MAG: DJ-1/PfpI family protein, partial [Acetatifactor sp.]|nr:DJ-1/PfpI family protein [Acetatifactor sp.]